MMNWWLQRFLGLEAFCRAVVLHIMLQIQSQWIHLVELWDQVLNS